MFNKLKILITIILFLFSFYYTKKIIEYFQAKDPLMQEIINKKDKFYREPIDAIITKNYVIPEINGKKINLKKSYKKMKKLGIFNESLLVFDDILPKYSYLTNYDKVIIPRNTNNISLIFEINDDISLFNGINDILEKNNVFGNILNINIDVTNTNFLNILGTDYYINTDYCLSFSEVINEECRINKKYTILSKENIISNNFLSNTKKAINNSNNIIIYRFNINNFDNLDIIIKYLKNNQYNISSIDDLIMTV